MKNFCDLTLVSEININRIKISVIPNFSINDEWVKVKSLISNTFSGIVESVEVNLVGKKSFTVSGDEVENSYHIIEHVLPDNYEVIYYQLEINVLSGKEIIEDLKNRIENLDGIYSPIKLLKAIQEIENYETKIL